MLTNNIRVKLIDWMGGDVSVVNAARVSFGKQKVSNGLDKGDKKLINYLAKHRHMSPFGHVFASFHVKAPIFVARQLVKHKFLRWNEISRRYVDDEPEFYVPDEWRGRAEDKKQGSSGLSDWNHGVGTGYRDQEQEFYDNVLNLYFNMLEAGTAPEQARMVLPQNTMTEWFWSGSLDAFSDMCDLRLKDDTQEETRVVAQQIDEYMEQLFPVSWVALRKDAND